MPINVKIIAKDLILDAELFDTQYSKRSLKSFLSRNDRTSGVISSIPRFLVKMPLDETAKTTVKAGDMGSDPRGTLLPYSSDLCP